MERKVIPAALLLLFVLHSACVPVRVVTLEEISFADRQRLDRKALTSEQRAADVTVGTFDDGSDAAGEQSTLVSEIVQSNLAGRTVNNLPLSDCYWLASDAAGDVGDQVRLSWNAQVREGAQADRSTDQFGLCSFRDIDTGVPVHSTQSGLDPEPFVYLYRPASEPVDEYPLIEILGGLLTAHPATETDPDSRCPGDREFHFSGEEQHVPSDQSYACVSRSGCEVTMCGLGCGYRPTGDQSLRLSIANELYLGDLTLDEESFEFSTDGTVIVPRWMKPNLMVVRGTRRLARSMAPVSGQVGRFSWETPVVGGSEGGYSMARELLEQRHRQHRAHRLSQSQRRAGGFHSDRRQPNPHPVAAYDL